MDWRMFRTLEMQTDKAGAGASMYFRHWGFCSFLPVPFPLLPLHPHFSPTMGSGDCCKRPHRIWENPDAKRILVHFEVTVKVKHFRLLMSCIVFTASYRTATDLFYDGINRTINYVDENCMLYA